MNYSTLYPNGAEPSIGDDEKVVVINASHTEPGDLQMIVQLLRPCIIRIGKTTKNRHSKYYHTYIWCKKPGLK